MWMFLLFIHSFLLFQEDVEFLTDEGAGWGLEATLQLTATILLCLTVKILPETLIYKAQPSKQAEPFLPRSQGRAHWEHTVPWCGQCGCSGCSQPWPGWGLMASWEKALAGGSSALPQQPDLRSRKAQINAWDLWIGSSSTTHSTQNCWLYSISAVFIWIHLPNSRAGKLSRLKMSCIHLIPLMNNMAD